MSSLPPVTSFNPSVTRTASSNDSVGIAAFSQRVAKAATTTHNGMVKVNSGSSISNLPHLHQQRNVYGTNLNVYPPLNSFQDTRAQKTVGLINIAKGNHAKLHQFFAARRVHAPQHVPPQEINAAVMSPQGFLNTINHRLNAIHGDNMKLVNMLRQTANKPFQEPLSNAENILINNIRNELNLIRNMV